MMAEDTRQDRRASFSALAEHSRNGMARASALASSKTGASKKIVIKNFKGTPPRARQRRARRPVSVRSHAGGQTHASWCVEAQQGVASLGFVAS